MNTVRLYFKFLAIHLKSALIYKASFLFSCMGHVLIVLNVYLGVAFLMERFGAVVWTWGRGLTLAMMILCGACVFFGVFMAGASLCFFTLEGLEVLNIFTDGVREYGKYPFDIYGKGVLTIVTAVVPFAMCQYWPLQYLLGRKEWVYGCFPLLSLWFLLPCFGLWRLGVGHYHSAGS